MLSTREFVWANIVFGCLLLLCECYVIQRKHIYLVCDSEHDSIHIFSKYYDLGAEMKISASGYVCGRMFFLLIGHWQMCCLWNVEFKWLFFLYKICANLGGELKCICLWWCGHTTTISETHDTSSPVVLGLGSRCSSIKFVFLFSIQHFET